MNTSSEPGAGSSFASPDFARFAQALSPEIRPLSPRAFALAFDDLSAQVVLHPDGQRIVLELFVCDASPLVDARRDIVVKALLTLNAAGLHGRPFVCGLDSRNFITLHALLPVNGLDPSSFSTAVEYLVHQARQVRQLLRDISFQDGGVSVVLPEPATTGEGP